MPINTQELEGSVNGKKARAIRKAAQLNGKLDLKTPDYRVSKEKKKVVYDSELVDGLMVNTVYLSTRKFAGGLMEKTLKQTMAAGGAEAQLMCQKPSTSGLVYPRFDGMSNVISLEDCFVRLTGEVPHNTSHDFLRDMLVNLGITFIGGADWGYTNYTSLVVLAIIPNGEVWLVDSFIQDKLELDDIVKYIKELNTIWRVDKWYVDQAYPAYIATLKRHGLRCPEFKKVVADGIAAIQSRIVDSSNTRRFFILDIPKNKHYIDSFGEYKWQLDRKGDVIEGEPYHDSDGYSDALDSLRYPFQNIFAKSQNYYSSKHRKYQSCSVS